MRMFFDDDIAELDAQLSRVLSRGSRDSVEEQARRDFAEILGRRGKGSSQELAGDAADLVKVADGLANEPAKPAMSEAHIDRVATAIESLSHSVGALAARPSAGQRAWSWLSSNPWRVATIALVSAGAAFAWQHYASKGKKKR